MKWFIETCNRGSGKHDIDSLNCNALYLKHRGHARHKLDQIILDQYFRENISSMKIIKKRLLNNTKNEFLTNNIMLNIEKETVGNFITDFIIDKFKSLNDKKISL